MSHYLRGRYAGKLFLKLTHFSGGVYETSKEAPQGNFAKHGENFLRDTKCSSCFLAVIGNVHFQYHFKVRLLEETDQSDKDADKEISRDVSQIEEEQKLIRSLLPKVTARSFSLEFAQPRCERFILVFTTFLEVLLNLQQAAVKLFK